jgi:hypothetical protein
VRINMRTSCHKTKRERATKKIIAQEPLDSIGKHCRKSPPKTTTLPPKGESGRYMMSHKVRSTASAQCRCCVGASSQTINFASQNSSAVSSTLSPYQWQLGS